MEIINEKERKKRERKLLIKQKNEPPRLTALEEIGNAVTHGIGAALAIAGMVLLLIKSDSSFKVMASCFYGISLFFMMLMSCLYHAFKGGTTVKRLWRRFDYTSIYLLIGGTFAPLYLVYWANMPGIVLFCLNWGVIICGIVLICVFGPGKWRPLHYTLYFLIGWSGLMIIPDLFRHNLPLMWMILNGGVFYTIGMVPFARNTKYSHLIWHFFVLIGALLHWLGIYFYLY